MSRLTKRKQTEGGIPFVDVEDTQEALGLLAQYEDIGSLEEFSEYKKAKADGRLVILPCKVGDTVFINTTCENIFMHVDNDYLIGTGAIECPFENLCNHEECNDENVSTLETICSQFILEENGNIVPMFDNVIANINAADFGKTVFLTREEAEKALESETEELK